MALRVLIVDDEADARDNLRLMLEEHSPEVQIVGQAGSATEAREKIATLQPNALFLDIKMPGEDGFALLASVAELDLPVVFVTAYDEFALKAFQQNALDYLEKPVDIDALQRAVKKLLRQTDEQGAVGMGSTISAQSALPVPGLLELFRARVVAQGYQVRRVLRSPWATPLDQSVLVATRRDAEITVFLNANGEFTDVAVILERKAP